MTEHKNKKLDVIVALFIVILFVFSWGARFGFSWSGSTNTFSPGYLEVDNVNVTSGFYWKSENRTVLVSGQNATGATAYVGFDDNLEYLPNYWLCDGTADDVEIQAALTYTIDLGGGSVFSDRGTYDITAELLINAATGLLFYGTDGTILRLADMTRDNIIRITNSTQITIADFDLDGNYANQNMAAWSMRDTGGPADPIELDLNNIYVTDSTFVTTRGVYSHDSGNNGILYQEGVSHSLVTECTVEDCQWHGIEFWRGGHYSIISDSEGIDCYQSNFVVELGVPADMHVIVANCISRYDDETHADSAGFLFQSMSAGSLIGCESYNHRLFISGADHVQVIGCKVYNVDMLAQGIRVIGDDNSIIGCEFYLPYYDGIRIEGDNNLVSNNRVQDSWRVGSNAINIISPSAGNMILKNIIQEWDHGVGINEEAGSSGSVIKGNRFIAVTVQYVNLQGTGTILDTHQIQFIQGTTFLSTAPFGWEIDLNAEYALALGALPLEVQQVVRWKIWATSVVGETYNMTLQIEGYGGADNEPYTTETIAVATLNSTSFNFAADDVIHWTVTSSDDADLDDFLGGDIIMIKVLHEAASGGACQTDAIFLCIEIEYV